MDKLISQQAAIEAVEFGITYAKAINKETGEVRELFKQSNEELRKAVERIKQLPSAEQEAPDINVGNMDITTHDSIPAETDKNDGDRTSGDCISRQAVKDIFTELYGISAIGSVFDKYEWADICETTANELPSVQPERKTGHWILNRSGAYCCDKCMEPCAGYVMMKPRDKFCKMCGADMRGEGVI